MLDPARELPSHVDITPSARHLLSQLPPKVKALLRELLELMDRSAQEKSVPITRTEIVARRDPEENMEKVVIRHWVDLPRETALDVWDKVGGDVDAWVNQLPEPVADLLAERTAFEVYSDVDDAAA